jgi:hypothetical protein
MRGLKEARRKALSMVLRKRSYPGLAIDMNQRSSHFKMNGDSANDSSLWKSAMVFAARAHNGSKSAKLGAPYIAHPARVAMIVAIEFQCSDPRILCAALLHDVLEKTETTLAEVAGQFGEEIAYWVFMLSKAPGEPKDSYWSALGRAPWQVRLVKVADVLDHLDCPPDQLFDRSDSVERALRIVQGDEEILDRARTRLVEVWRGSEPLTRAQK